MNAPDYSVGRGGEDDKPLSYGFPHRTLQEYLAGCYLVGLRNMQREYFDLAGEGDYWSLAVQLGVEELYYNRQNPYGLLDLAYYLCGPDEPRNEKGWRAWLWSARMAILAGREKIEEDEEHGGSVYLERLVPGLAKLLGNGLPATEHAEAGRALAKLGDPRQEIMSCDAMQFCWIPAGPFQMGSDEEADPQSLENEQPLHTVELPDFAISRYPITQAQYAEFVDANGYKEHTFWDEAVEAGYWQNGAYKGRWDNEPRAAPADFGEKYLLPNQPVVGISWYEALAYCRWLSREWVSKHLLLANWKVNLPSEAEWEKAARGGLLIPAQPIVLGVREVGGAKTTKIGEIDNPEPAKRYPWGNEFDDEKANTSESRIGNPNSAGCFPEGASPYGVLDLSGNILEWTRSSYQKYPYTFQNVPLEQIEKQGVVLRGGSFSNFSRGARCAYRDWNAPASRYYGLGFRVVLSPFQL